MQTIRMMHHSLYLLLINRKITASCDMVEFYWIISNNMFTSKNYDFKKLFENRKTVLTNVLAHWQVSYCSLWFCTLYILL